MISIDKSHLLSPSRNIQQYPATNNYNFLLTQKLQQCRFTSAAPSAHSNSRFNGINADFADAFIPLTHCINYNIWRLNQR